VSAPIYLDHAATTPLSDTAWRAMEPYLRERFGNPSEPHAAGRAARAGLDEARASVAATLGCAPAELVFTGGGSEADNLAVLGRLRDGGRVVASAIEHPPGPIQFCVRRNSPGARSPPRTPRISFSCISRMKRRLSGSFSRRSSP